MNICFQGQDRDEDLKDSSEDWPWDYITKEALDYTTKETSRFLGYQPSKEIIKFAGILAYLGLLPLVNSLCVIGVDLSGIPDCHLAALARRVSQEKTLYWPKHCR